MSDILGYDVNGEPLRAGDRVALIRNPTSKRCAGIKAGAVFTVTDIPVDPCWDDGIPRVVLDHNMPFGAAAHCDKIRKINPDDHKPCGLSFDELVKGFKGVTA